MRDDDENPKIPNENSDSSGVSRRDFLKISGISVAVPLVAGPKMVMAAGQEVPVYGPGKVPMEFAVNGKNYDLTHGSGNTWISTTTNIPTSSIDGAALLTRSAAPEPAEPTITGLGDSGGAS